MTDVDADAGLRAARSQARAATANPLGAATARLHYAARLEDALDLEAHYAYLLSKTEDRAEGMKAFLEKRNPAWTQPEQDVSEASPVGKGQS